MKPTLKYKLRLITAKICRIIPFFASLLIFLQKRKDARNGSSLSNSIDLMIKDRGFEPTKKLKDDIWKAININLLDPIEYFAFKFYEKSRKEKNKFIGNIERRLACLILNKNAPSHIFAYKWQTYVKFEKYFKREMIHITSEQDREIFMSFLESHGKIMLKKENCGGGLGIYVITEKKEAEQIFNDIMPEIKKGFVAEQYLIQAEALKNLNPTSVNTVRIATFLDGTKLIKLFAVVRVGRKGMFVDNATSGGVFAPVDIETGICSNGFFSEKGEFFDKHPDHGYDIKGFQIPEWQSLLKIVDELAAVVPEQKYVSWDMAFTDNGWALIEGNSRGQVFFPQVTEQKGFRDTANKTWYKYVNIWNLFS